jgi:hypothetical protein
LSTRFASNTTVWDNISVREIPGTHAHALTDAARPTLGAFGGVGGTLAAQFNGSSQAMQTVAPLDMSSTDEVTVIAAVRSLSDALAQVIVESSDGAANGRFALFRPVGAGTTGVSFRSSGTAVITVTASGYGATANYILTGSAKIATPAAQLFVNGTSVASSAATQGTGNYGNHLINIGIRNAASPTLPFNGHIAALCIVGLRPSNLPAGWLETMTGILTPPGVAFT